MKVDDLAELRQRTMAEIPCHDPFSWISPEEVIALLDALAAQQQVVEAALVLIERHERFHPDFWARERNCPECTFCHAARDALAGVGGS